MCGTVNLKILTTSLWKRRDRKLTFGLQLKSLGQLNNFGSEYHLKLTMLLRMFVEYSFEIMEELRLKE